MLAVLPSARAGRSAFRRKRWSVAVTLNCKAESRIGYAGRSANGRIALFQALLRAQRVSPEGSKYTAGWTKNPWHSNVIDRARDHSQEILQVTHNRWPYSNSKEKMNMLGKCFVNKTTLWKATRELQKDGGRWTLSYKKKGEQMQFDLFHPGLSGGAHHSSRGIKTRRTCSS